MPQLFIPSKPPLEPNWMKFLHYNSEDFPKTEYRKMSILHVAQFIGKHLYSTDGDQLWGILVEGFQPPSLWILQNEEVKTVGRPSRSWTIYLDDAFLISDIEIWC